MTIADVARATRKYSVYHAPGDQYWYVSAAPDILEFRGFGIVATLTPDREAQAACDRLNLLAVLEALREPSEGMPHIAAAKDEVSEECIDAFYCAIVWRAMIDALIAEVKE